jgi:hypothetical protein
VGTIYKTVGDMSKIDLDSSYAELADFPETDGWGIGHTGGMTKQFPLNKQGLKKVVFENSQVYDIRQNLTGQMDYTGATDYRTLIQYALDYAPIGSTVYVPRLAKVSKNGANGYCLLMTRLVNLWCDGTIRADLTAVTDDAVDLLRVSVADAGGSGDVRQHVIKLNALLNGGGRSSLRVEANLPVIRMVVAGGLMGGLAGPAAFFGGDMQGTMVINNDLNNGVEFGQVGGAYHNDAIVVRDNYIYGNRPGVVLDVTEGSYTHEIQHNVIVSRDGAIDIKSGSQVKIRDNQFEQNGNNAGTYDSTVTIRGERYQSDSCEVTGNNFGGGTDVSINMTVVNANATLIENNDWFPSASTIDVNLAAATAKNTRIGINRARGTTRGVMGLKEILVADSGVANAGIRKLWSALTFANSWANVDGHMIMRDGRVTLGGTINSGVTTPGTLITTLPVGYRPPVDETIVVATSAGPGTIAINADGTVKAGTLPSNSVGLGGSFMTVGDI